MTTGCLVALCHVLLLIDASTTSRIVCSRNHHVRSPAPSALASSRAWPERMSRQAVSQAAADGLQAEENSKYSLGTAESPGLVCTGYPMGLLFFPLLESGIWRVMK